jgi:hypothetical protein
MAPKYLMPGYTIMKYLLITRVYSQNIILRKFAESIEAKIVKEGKSSIEQIPMNTLGTTATSSRSNTVAAWLAGRTN